MRACLPILIVVATSASVGADGAEPSFDCTKAESGAEKLVCGDDRLAALDNELQRLFALARDGAHMTEERLGELRAYQRGWIKGRDDCWKAADSAICVRDAYALRIANLRQGYFDARQDDDNGITLGPKVLACDGFNALIGVSFIQTEPQLVTLEWLDRALVLEQKPTASGARYADAGTSIWFKGDDARLEVDGGEALACAVEEVG